MRTIATTTAVLAALLLAACGSSSSDDGGAGSGAAAANAQDTARVKLQACLRRSGVDVPDTTDGGAPPQLTESDRQKLQDAIAGPCKADSTAAFGTDGPGSQEFSDRFAAFASCMRRNGVDVPDITAGGTPPATGAVDPDDPEVERAMKACRSVAPAGLPGGAGR